jgi:hypothetical protein
MDVRERRFLVEEAARARAESQLMAFEAACFPNMEAYTRREVTARYQAMLSDEPTHIRTQEEIWAANRASLFSSVPRRKLGRKS